MKVFRYVVVHDGGSAPNYQPPYVTLAICKPQIRKGAGIGDMVIGFQGGRLGSDPHGVRWVGIVSEKMRFEEYWQDERFRSKRPDRSDRSDNIYAPGQHGLIQIKNEVHDWGNRETDLSGRYVLAFSKSWTFGRLAPTMPTEFSLRILLPNRRGHRVSEISDIEAERLVAWLDMNIEKLREQRPSLLDTSEIDQILSKPAAGF